MDIDKLFKVPKYPVGGVKRKMPDNPTPEMLKRMRMDIEPEDTAVVGTTNGSHKDKGESRAAAVHDETGEDVSDDFAPGGDADYFAEEDEEGRFFGGGLTAEQKEILNIFDNASGDAQYMEDLSATGIRKLLLKLERTVNKNQEQRSKYPDDPTKFIESEADLDSSIKSLLPLAQVPATAYPELIRSNTVGLLVGLLSHENADIVIDVVEVFHELTDEDVGGEDADEEDSQSNSEALKSLVEALLENSILDLLVENLQRLNEDEESDRQGVFHMLGTFENLLSFNPSLATQLVSKTNFLPWVLGRIQAKRFDENRAYAAEILSILLQDNQTNRQALGKTDGIEVLLKVLSHYRKRDPADADETEFMENVFDSLCSALGEPSNKELFIQAEGPDLMVLMMKEKLRSCSRAIKTLDFAMSGSSGTRSCEAFIEALGLRTLFSIFMGKGAKKKNSTSVLPASEDTSHILGIISSLFSNIASETPERVRLLAKFVENGYEKVDRLLEIRDNARTRLRATEKQIEAQKKELIEAGEEIDPEEEASLYLQRLEGGLYTLQSVDYVLGWVAMEDDGIRAHLSKMMDRKNQSLRDIVQTLKIYMENVDEEGSGDGSSQTVILQGLIEALNVN